MSEGSVVAVDGPDMAFLRRMLIVSAQRHPIFFRVLSLADTPLPTADSVHSTIGGVIPWERWAQLF